MEQRSSPVRLSSAMSGNQKPRTLARDISESLGKLPPQALDLEEAILGALMLEKDAITYVSDFLRPSHFYSNQHEEIYEAIISLFKASEPIDMRTVVARLRKNGKLELAGGAFFIAELTSKISSAANIEFHSRLVIEMSIKRDLIQIASQIHHDAYEDTSDAHELVQQSMTSIEQITSRNFSGKYSDAMSIVNESVKEAEEKRNHKGLTGIPTGLSKFDRVMAGWQRTDLIIIAARPGMGKTAFVCAITKNAAVQYQVPVGIFSLEMEKNQLINRMVCSDSEVDISRLNKGQTSDEEMKRFREAGAKIAMSPIYIDDTAALSIMDFRARARRMVMEKNVKLIVVDYLQLMKGESQGNREQEISSISRGLKRVAKELNIPVIALSQLSRGVESRGGDKRPMLSDLRESGSIEQDADIVLFLYRAEYYKITELEDGRPSNNVMEAIIAKYRSGALDTIPIKFIGQHMKVTDWDSAPEPNVFNKEERGKLTPLSELTKTSSYRNPGESDKAEDDSEQLPF